MKLGLGRSLRLVQCEWQSPESGLICRKEQDPSPRFGTAVMPPYAHSPSQPLPGETPVDITCHGS